MSFVCSCCGKIHDGLPALTLLRPDHWLSLTADQQAEGKCGDDLCKTPDGHFFVRCVLSIPLIDGPEQTLEFGPWCSLSEENFYRYVETFDDADQSKLGQMFGWFSNELSGFPQSLNLKCNVVPQDGRKRPRIELQPTEHPLSIAQRSGLAWQTALEIAHGHVGDGWAH
ncbi:MAG: DUF2199 domain-containing protein [Hyphomonadaceae bacterium]|nr:DUF2199 domain-containing protein [Hyphomonadaceae bacterium]